MRWLSIALVVLACSDAPKTPADADEQRAVDAWRKRRMAGLTSETGWLSLAGLHFLKEGAQSAGSAEGNDIRLPEHAAPKLGTFELKGGKITFTAAPGVEVKGGGKPVQQIELKSDAGAAEPTTLKSGTLSFFVIKRGERFAIRLRDSESKARKSFHGIESYPIDAKWRVTARWEPLAAPASIPVPTILGTIEPMSSPGVAVFQLDGKEQRLQPVIEEGETRLFFIFADATTGKETYGAGRFLYADVAKDGRVILDFNLAYNPPCAFTPYATCPLPPAQNKLAVAIRAGEKNYAHH
jgi:uncharacterized protein (DUF1684 family)